MGIKAAIGHKDSSDGIQFIMRDKRTNKIKGWTWVRNDLTITHWTYDNRTFKSAPNWDRAVYQALARAI
jgi:hypothetical protein